MSSISRAARLAAAPLLLTSLAAGCGGPLPSGPGAAAGADPPGAPDTPDMPGAPPEAPAGEHGGTLPDGATWRAVVPDGWNGTLLLYGHGYTPSFVPGPNPNPLGPGTAAEQALLGEGYALAASSYATKGWAVPTAVQDQQDALAAAVDAIGARPDRVLAYGTSMGGLVTGQLAEEPGDGTAAPAIEGALATCGLMAGGVGLLDHQLDGAHAIAELLAPDQAIDLVGYATVAEASAAAGALGAAVDAGQQTPEGRARVALAAALFHLPRQPQTGPAPAPDDAAAIQRAWYGWLDSTLGFVVPARADIESAVGGNPSANAGVDYRQLFRRSADRRVVEDLYRGAGLDLAADLDRLTAAAGTRAEPAARASLRRTSTVSGRLDVPVLAFHTTTDNLAPVQFEEEYGEEVGRAGHRSLLRQAYVDRVGHCAFTPAELVAGVHALEHRVATGRWDGAARWSRLDAAAEALGLGAADFVAFRPGEFLGDRPVIEPR